MPRREGATTFLGYQKVSGPSASASAPVLKSRFIESRPEGAITCEQRPGWAVEGGVEDAAGKRGALEGFGVAFFCTPERT